MTMIKASVNTQVEILAEQFPSGKKNADLE